MGITFKPFRQGFFYCRYKTAEVYNKNQYKGYQ